LNYFFERHTHLLHFLLRVKERFGIPCHLQHIFRPIFPSVNSEKGGGFDDGGSTHLWNVGQHLLDYTAVHPRRHYKLHTRRRENLKSHILWTVPCRTLPTLRLSYQHYAWATKFLLKPFRSAKQELDHLHLYCRLDSVFRTQIKYMRLTNHLNTSFPITICLQHYWRK
jgi:hypothetical protein